MSQVKPPLMPSTADRKKKLLADGALHRANILVARADIAAGVQPGALVKDALTHITEVAKTLVGDTLRIGTMNPAKLSPLLLTGFSLLSRTYIRKPLMYVGLAGGAIAGALYLIKLFSATNTEADPLSEDDQA